MRSRIALLPVLALLPLLSGCFWWGVAAGSGTSESGSSTVAAPAETDAEAAVRNAIPPIEAYHADNQTYMGAERVGKIYGVPLGNVRIVVLENGHGYCVEAPAAAPSAHYDGPGGTVSPGPC
jgi:hypothetical protein